MPRTRPREEEEKERRDSEALKDASYACSRELTEKNGVKISGPKTPLISNLCAAVVPNMGVFGPLIWFELALFRHPNNADPGWFSGPVSLYRDQS